VWQLNNEHPMYSDCQTDGLRVARQLYDSTICLPSSANIRDAEIEFVANTLKRLLRY